MAEPSAAKPTARPPSARAASPSATKRPPTDELCDLVWEKLAAELGRMEQLAARTEQARQKQLDDHLQNIDRLISAKNDEIIFQVGRQASGLPAREASNPRELVATWQSERSGAANLSDIGKEKDTTSVVTPPPADNGQTANVMRGSTLGEDKLKETKIKANQGIMGDSATRVASSEYFQAFSHLLVLGNTIFIGIESDANIVLALEDPTAEEPWWCGVVNRIFTVFFCLELCVRIIALRRSFFCGDEWRWNMFDFILVFSGLMEEFLQSLNLSFARILRLGRLLRAGRILRVVRFLQALRLLVCCIFNSLTSLFWALFLLFLIMYLFSIMWLTGGIGWLRDHPELAGIGSQSLMTDVMSYDLAPVDLRASLDIHYSGLARTLLTMLSSITGGVSWVDVMKPFMGISFMYVYLFILYITFVMFGVLNVITGVFVESAMDLRDRDILINNEIHRADEFLKDMSELFAEADLDGTGFVSWDEMEPYLKHQRVIAYFMSQELDVSDAYTIYKLLDTDKSGEINLKEFAAGCMKLRGVAKAIHLQELAHDTDNLTKDVKRQIKDVRILLEYLIDRMALRGVASEPAPSGAVHAVAPPPNGALSAVAPPPSAAANSIAPVAEIFFA